jgi:hypothetical protein
VLPKRREYRVQFLVPKWDRKHGGQQYHPANQVLLMGAEQMKTICPAHQDPESVGISFLDTFSVPLGLQRFHFLQLSSGYCQNLVFSPGHLLVSHTMQVHGVPTKVALKHTNHLYFQAICKDSDNFFNIFFCLFNWFDKRHDSKK